MNRKECVCHPIYNFLPYPQHPAEGLECHRFKDKTSSCALQVRGRIPHDFFAAGFEGRRLSGAMKKLNKGGERPLPIPRVPLNDATCDGKWAMPYELKNVYTSGNISIDLFERVKTGLKFYLAGEGFVICCFINVTG